VLPPRELHYVLGDLQEEYVLLARSRSVPAANAWYWMQICRSAPVLVDTGIAGVGRIRTIAIAVLVYVAASIVEALGTAGLTLLPLGSMTFQVASTVVGLSSILAAGYVAARIQPPAVPVLAIIVLAIVVVLMATREDGLPLWYQVAFLIGGPLAALGGAAPAFRRPFNSSGNPDSN
jgi:hypothetical protein